MAVVSDDRNYTSTHCRRSDSPVLWLKTNGGSLPDIMQWPWRRYSCIS